MLGVVLAAGRGQRLRPLTDGRSKAMLPVAGKPMVARVLEMLIEGGVDRLIVVGHPEDAELRAYLNRPEWADRVTLTVQAERRGMAQALQSAAPLIRASGVSDFVLAACDNFFPSGHVAACVSQHRGTGADATVTLMRVRPEQIPTLAVVVLRDGWVEAIVEKPRPEEAPSDLGVPSLHVLSVRALGYLGRVPISPRGEYEFPDVLRLLIEGGGRVGGVEVAGRMTLTRPDDLLALNRYFLRHDPVSAVVEADVTGCVVAPVRIEAGVALGPGCIVGPEVFLEAGCHCGSGAILRRAIVLRGAEVAAGVLVEDAVLG
ncbi:MAG: NTP transferase domain-containing protein [Anaerolineales bacterium]|nr:NTP transferase domain-containing protein [Anaerolineales bacterium]